MTKQEANELACGLARMQIESGLCDELWPAPLSEDPEHGYEEEDRQLIISALDTLCEDLRKVEEGKAAVLTFPKEVQCN